MKPQELLIWLTLISSLSIIFAWGITKLGKTMSAAWQYFIWLLAMLAPLVAILLLLANLHLDVPLLQGEKKGSPNIETVPLPAIASGQQSEAAGNLLPTSPSLVLPAIVFLWATIALAWIAYLGAEHLRMHRRLRRTKSIDHDSILGKAITGLPSPYPLERIKTSETPVPFCYGFIRPVIILPSRAGQWDAEKLRACLLHETAHLKRRDLWFFALTQLSCAFCWFNPLIWLAASRIRNLAEIAADDMVVSREMRPESYAASLLSVSESIIDAKFSRVAFSMFRPANLKSRLEHVLDDTARRETPHRLPMAMASVTLVLLLTMITSVRLVAADENDKAGSGPTPQAPGFHAKDKSEIVTKTRVTTDIALQAMLIGMPTSDAAEFSTEHNLVKEPTEALAALQRLAKENHATIISIPALVTRSGVQAQTNSDATTFRAHAVVGPDGKSLEIQTAVERNANTLAVTVNAKNGDTMFLGTIADSQNPAVTEFVFLRVSVVDHEGKIENLVPKKSETDTLLGQWVNPSPDGTGLNRLLISRVGSQLVIQGWETRDGKEYDWGQTGLHIENQYSAQWSSDFGTLFVRFTKEGNHLSMEAFASEPKGKVNRRSYLAFQKGT